MNKNVIITAILVTASLMACSPRMVSKDSAPERKERISRKAKEYFIKGVFLQLEERYHEALVQFHKAQIFDTSSVTISNNLAETYLKLGEFDPALYHLKRARMIDPDNEQTLHLLGECYFRLQDDEKAISIFKRLLAKNPYNEQARNYLLFLYGKNNNEIGKAEIFEQLIELYGRDPLLLEKVAKIYFDHKDYEKARHFYNEILNDDSTDAQIIYTVGTIEEIQQHYDEAIFLFEKALSIDSTQFDALERLTMLYRRQEKWQKVIDLYQPMFQKDSSDLYSRLLIAEARFYMRDFEQAENLLLPVLDRETVPWGVYDLLGKIALENENHDSALGYFNKIIEKDKKNRYGWLFVGFAYNSMDSLKEAEKNYEEAVKHLPSDAMLWAYLGMTQQQRKNDTEAVISYTRALQLDPYNINALSSLPILYELLGEYQKCDSLYEVAIERFPENAMLLNNFSYSLSERNIDLERSLLMVKKALKIDPDRPAYLDTIGWIYYKLEKYKEAEKYISKSLEFQPQAPVVLEHLGDVYYKLGKLNLAKTYWKKSLEIDTENEVLQEKLEAHK